MTLTGIHLPLITPFTDGGDVALDALERLAHDALAQGAAGLVALGTTAEAATLSEAERRQVVGVCARVCRSHDAPLSVGAGNADTLGSATALERLAEWPEITAALVTVPSFTRPGQAGVLAHFTRLAAHSPVPLIVYHVPYRTGQPLDAATLRALGHLPGIVGVKFAAGFDQTAVDLLADLPPDFAVLAGDDPFVSPMLALGAPGAILASAHLATAGFAALATAWQAGDVPAARALGHRLSPVSAALFAEPNPTVIKGVLHAQGRIPTPAVRLPLLPAAPSSVERALAAVDRLQPSPV
ncbi:4-hydroxy-tetrahydrodipicolinate synthase [Streptacidiphilus sp. 4-A2]|nr:4-hydroxy-tetrahydrodipicolinate synthase [Streptacidiphilus sp. 4-A2]